MESREKTRLLTGGLILITLGVLIILSKMGVWKFGQSWPLLLIVIAVGTLAHRISDFGGWIIGCVGLFFLLSESLELKFYAITTFLLPALLILVGINIIMKYMKKRN
jgi:predicted membrane protein